MKLSLSMYSLVAAVHAERMDLMGFVDYAAAQGVAGVELLDIFWTDAEREIPLVKRRHRGRRHGSGGVFHQQ